MYNSFRIYLQYVDVHVHTCKRLLIDSLKKNSKYTNEVTAK